MKKDILTKGVLMPVVIGIIVTIAVFSSLMGARNFFPVKNGVSIAYFDAKKQSSKDDKKTASFNDVKDNQIIGKVSYGKNSMDLVYHSDYSNLVDSFSVEGGSPLGQVGLCYIYVLQNNLTDFNKDNITVDSAFGKHSYKFVESYSANNENQVKLYDSSVKKGIVIYYQGAKDYGFSTGYQALVYQEVQ